MASCKYWIEYTKDWRQLPMAYWVHVEQDSRAWWNAERFLPAAPALVAHKGYPVICAEYQEFVLRFSSSAQLQEFVRVLRMKPLPTVRRLAAMRGGGGLNGHWLSELPAKLKTPRVREKLVRSLDRVLAEVTKSGVPV